LNIAIWQKGDVILSALIFFVSFFYQEKKEKGNEEKGIQRNEEYYECNL
jgi:hypothetical protein